VTRTHLQHWAYQGFLVPRLQARLRYMQAFGIHRETVPHFFGGELVINREASLSGRKG
jgi:hypothetical protein